MRIKPMKTLVEKALIFSLIVSVAVAGLAIARPAIESVQAKFNQINTILKGE